MTERKLDLPDDLISSKPSDQPCTPKASVPNFDMAESVYDEKTKKAASEDASDDCSSKEGDAEKPEKKKTKTLSELKNSSLEESLEEGDSSTKATEKASTSPEENPKRPCSQKQQSMGSRTLFVGNLSFSVEQADVENFFQTAGEIVGIRFAMSPDSAFRGFGYVEFASVEAAKKALEELNGRELLRRPVRLDIVREPYTPYGSGFSGDQTKLLQEGGRAQVQSIFIRGFNKHDSEEQIRTSLEEHFRSCGEIIKLSIPKDQDGGIKGIAYLDFKDIDAVKRALELNGSEIGGNALFVVVARPRGISRGGRGFRGWGGRSGGGWNFGGRFGGRFAGRGSHYWSWDENNYFR